MALAAVAATVAVLKLRSVASASEGAALRVGSAKLQAAVGEAEAEVLEDDEEAVEVVRLLELHSLLAASEAGVLTASLVLAQDSWKRPHAASPCARAVPQTQSCPPPPTRRPRPRSPRSARGLL